VVVSDCLDGPDGCRGEVFRRAALSGSGLYWPRCDRHYQLYVERLTPIIDDVNRRYPKFPPADFDPLYAGEQWDEDE